MNFQGDWFHLFNDKEDKHGNKEFDAVLDFFHHFNGFWHVDEVENKSMMVQESIIPLFVDTDYTVNVIDNFYANTMSYSKQQNSTERFLYFIGRHNAEFNIPIGTKTVQLRNRIGVRRNDVLIHEDDNLVDLNIDTDTGSFCTAIKGYYDFQAVDGNDEDTSEKEPRKTYDYISPMASKYGIHWGEPIHDERYSTLEGIQEATRLKQESTWKTSFTLKADLFQTPLNEGDEVRLVYPSKDINMYIRVVEINEVFDEEGDLIDAEYTFGNENISAEYRKMQYDAIQDVRDILLGKKSLPYNVLPKAMRQAADIVLGDDDSVMTYRKDRMTGHHSKNEGNNITVNASGLVLHHNFEPTTAITHLGIVANALTVGWIDTNNIYIQGTEGHFIIDGDMLKATDYNNPDIWTEIKPSGLTTKGSLTIIRPDAYIDNGVKYGYYMENGLPKLNFDLQRNQFMHSGIVTFTGQRYQISGANSVAGQAYNLETFNTVHNAKNIRVDFNMGISGIRSSYVKVEVVELGGSVVATHNRFVRETDDYIWGRIDFSIGVPNYSDGNGYYIRAGSSVVSSSSYTQVFVSRVSMYG